MTSHPAVLELTSPDAPTRRASSDLASAVEQAIASSDSGSVVLVVGGVEVDAPVAVLRALLHAAHEQAAGHRVRIISPDSTSELTPNQAAAYLGISRPLLVKLLDDGTIPARTLPGSRHRRIAVADLEEYTARKVRRRRTLAAAMNDVAGADLYFPAD
ncbi:helix-turn-helix domain-containing protein [Candidatus Protofrankia californiensis]|uniref:helix-turn-helix domain-containing protein n=1 Tax=Candidatus Protofrankia californiensis TaxID=1839754 RepID=UPI0010412D45|nr:helix-turn-helix domain-containing protein [Candidatus Protofrankia californiensis]